MVQRLSFSLVFLSTLVLSVKAAPTAGPYFPTVSYYGSHDNVAARDNVDTSSSRQGFTDGGSVDSGKGDVPPVDNGPCTGTSFLSRLMIILPY